MRDEAIACLALPDLTPEIEHAKVLRPIRFDPQLRYALLAQQEGSKQARLFRMADGEDLGALALPGEPRGALFSPDSERVLVKCHSPSDQEVDASYSLFETRTGRLLWTREEPISFKSMAFDAGGDRVAVGLFGGTVRFLEAGSGEELFRIDVGSRTGDLAFHPGGRSIALGVGGGRNLLQIRSLPDGGVLNEYSVPRSPYEVAWLRDGRVALACADFKSYLFDPNENVAPVVLEGHTAEVVGLHASPTTDLLVTNSWDGTARVWHSVTGAEIFSTVSSVLGFSRDGTRLAWTTRDTFGTWRVEFGGVLRTLHGHDDKFPRRAAFAPDNRHMISLGGDGALLWDLTTGTQLRWLTRKAVNSALFPSDDGRVLISGAEGLLAYRLDDPSVREPLLAAEARSAASSSDGRFAAVRLDGNDVALLDLSDRSNDRVLSGPYPGSSITCSPDGRLVAGGTWKGRGFHVWNAVSGELEHESLEDMEGVTVAFSPDGEFLLAGTVEEYILYRVSTWEPVRAHERPPTTSSTGGSGAFSPDGSLLALKMAHYRVSLFDMRTGELLATLESPERSAPGGLGFSPDGRYLAAACSDNTIQLWDLRAMWRELERIGL